VTLIMCLSFDSMILIKYVPIPYHLTWLDLLVIDRTKVYTRLPRKELENASDGDRDNLYERSPPLRHSIQIILGGKRVVSKVYCSNFNADGISSCTGLSS
jgi:hypothetical protein